MLRIKALAVVAFAAWALPVTAWAFSFGTFAPGERILSIQLASGDQLSPTVTFDGTTNTMVFDASVSTITTNLGIYSIPLGDVLFSSTVMIVGGTEQVFPPFLVGAEFANGVTSDLSILDAGPGGSGLLLEGDYVGSLGFSATSPGGGGFPVVGSLGGDFDATGGDAAFLAAFGPGGGYFANLASFRTGGGSAVGSNLCLLIDGGCPSGTTIASFTVNPAATITPIPEPSVAALTAIGLTLLARRRRVR